MKIWIYILLFFPVVCFSQNKTEVAVAEKPATDDCPTWNKKQKTNKADYFKFLRSSQPKKSTEFVNKTYPNGSSYDKNRAVPVYNGTSRKVKRLNTTTMQMEGEEDERSDKKKEVEIAKEEKESVPEKADKPAEIELEIPIIDNKNNDVVEKTEDSVVVSTIITDVKKVEPKQEIEKEKKSEISSIAKKNKVKKETKDASRKVKRFFKRKHKKSKATSCPDF